MLYQELIRRKRDGGTLTAAELGAIVAGISDGSMGDAQLGAFAMAVLLRGMDLTERVALTTAMRDSGDVMEWDRGPVIDKHSTGGIGDTVSLMLMPAMAACGAVVPSIAGRGLGHTGGTLDKLESIPGYDIAPDAARLRRIVAQTGCALVGQTAALAPADKRFYAIRDVTGTVESLDLITASILSKKLAEGLDALVLDVKCGNGAFMEDLDSARNLARALVDVGNGAGCRTVALITDMSQPLAPAAGNALEMNLTLDFLTGRAVDARLWRVTCALGGEALTLAGLANDPEQGVSMLENAFRSGAAAECFGRMVAALGGPADLLENAQAYLPAAPVTQVVAAPSAGVVTGYDTRAIGLAVIGLGGGRRQPSDRIDPRVGFAEIAPVGQRVQAGDPLAIVHAADTDSAALATKAYLAACRIGDTPAAAPAPLVLDRISG
ncbi:thymidine phosphorylase [Roseinatronobacter alkalisoli]|uniref:Thymidine phosphorylase n=1 Tax=Roseinatronobacter alkalisoli TaxID=3028235 RepID=A0ABT5T5N0_9RHOB|nr:thymidine phosphorylase [Roseinatronobacter sp. HJB301]MDD7970025.1 thymidine phosphorylase [Roseinatronobacter sp. HJB301]